jgi:hypothetical protein
MRIWLLIALLGLLFIGRADAQQAVCGWPSKPCVVQGSVGTGGFTAVTLTGSSTQILAANPARKLLAISNESTTATIACAFGSTVAAINTAGSWTIPPTLTRVWSGPYIPGDTLNCVSSAAPSPATVEEN